MQCFVQLLALVAGFSLSESASGGTCAVTTQHGDYTVVKLVTYLLLILP